MTTIWKTTLTEDEGNYNCDLMFNTSEFDCWGVSSESREACLDEGRSFIDVVAGNQAWNERLRVGVHITSHRLKRLNDFLLSFKPHSIL